MSGDDRSADDRFERDLEAGLRELATEPAPERLVHRVGSIPTGTSTHSTWGSFMRYAAPLATAAVISLAIIAAVVVGTGGAPHATTAPGVGASPTAVEPASPAPTEPTGSAAPSTLVLPPPATPPAASTPPASTAGPAGGPIPAGFQVFSVTFASPDLGWALGTAPCTSSPCTSIVRTGDGGRTWVGIPAPHAPLLAAGAVTDSGVSNLRFADALDGWAYGPDLWATHDGGATWHRLAIPGAGSAAVVALEASAGVVHAALIDPGAALRVASSPVNGDAWRLASVSVDVGAGPVPSPQLVLAGTSGWLVEVDRTVVGGARLSAGTWTPWTPPCLDVAGPAVLAASSPTEVVAACDVGLWSTPRGVHLFVSHDGGTTFAPSGSKIPSEWTGALASNATGSIFALGTTAQGSGVVRSADGGQTWRTSLKTGNAEVTYIGFTTPTQGVVLTIAPAGTGAVVGGSLLMTRDGGDTWRQVTFTQK